MACGWRPPSARAARPSCLVAHDTFGAVEAAVLAAARGGPARSARWRYPLSGQFVRLLCHGAARSGRGAAGSPNCSGRTTVRLLLAAPCGAGVAIDPGGHEPGPGGSARGVAARCLPCGRGAKGPGPVGAGSGRVQPLGGAGAPHRSRKAAGLLAVGSRAPGPLVRVAIGLRVWRERIVLRPEGFGRAICFRSGLTSAAAQALERRLCEPTGRLPRPVLSALRDGRLRLSGGYTRVGGARR